MGKEEGQGDPPGGIGQQGEEIPPALGGQTAHAEVQGVLNPFGEEEVDGVDDSGDKGGDRHTRQYHSKGADAVFPGEGVD